MRHSTDRSDVRPTIAIAMGDPAGISPELAAKLLALDEMGEAAQLVMFGDRRILEMGAKVAGVTLDLEIVESVERLPDRSDRPVMVDLRHLGPDEVTPATATLAGGGFATENFRRALLFANEGRGGRRVLHALQQEGDAARLSGL